MRAVLRSALLACALASAAWPGFAAAQDGTADDAQVQDLYEKALQSIAEGRKTDASETLMEVIEQEPLHAGAYLEVALIQCSLGRSDEAERLFAIVETRFDPPTGILELIAEARESGCTTWNASTSSSVSLGRGVDQNVNQGASNPIYIVATNGGEIELPLLPDFLPKKDQFSFYSADYMREITANGTLGFVQLQGRRNDRLDEYDSSSVHFGVEVPHRFGRWTSRTSATAGLVSLGGHYYQRQLQLQVRVAPPLPLPAHTRFDMTGSATRTEYLRLTNFDSNLFEARGHLSYRKEDFDVSASLGYQNDLALAQRPGGDRIGYALNLLARTKMGKVLDAELGFTRQRWQSADAYSPGLIDQARDQTTDVLRAALIYPMNKHHSLHLEARAIRNKESIAFFEYDNRQLQLSWQWQTP
jgi:hypothetical protein